MARQPDKPVVILGAGVNGAALARELVLNRVPVILVDNSDIASGTTAYSSRLIHGGLRYLEHAEFSLVFESLAERQRLLTLAPQFVQPLELQIPVSQRGGGWLPAIRRFAGLGSGPARPRGLRLIRTGLRMYDQLARDRQLPRHRVLTSGTPEAVPVDSGRFPWLCAYWDAQMIYPERFVVALLDDARQAAREIGVEFSLYTYHQVLRTEKGLAIFAAGREPSDAERVVEAAAVVNATGAWVDQTLRTLDVAAERKIGGTKGSHFVSFNQPLREALSGRGLYAEAQDGRPVFVLPFGSAVLVGTTDLPFEGDPARAVASDEELDYLLALVRELLPQIPLERSDIHLHYAGVRPLPHSRRRRPGAITRRHWVDKRQEGTLPVFSLIGGKLTTCRSLAEQAAGDVLDTLGWPRVGDSKQRIVPGAENYPPLDQVGEAYLGLLARQTGWTLPQVRCVWPLLGTRTMQVLASARGVGKQNVQGTDLPLAVARWAIENEWASHLNDLVERRLMLLYHPRLSRASLEQLAQLLVATGKLPREAAAAEVESSLTRLKSHYGMTGL